MASQPKSNQTRTGAKGPTPASADTRHPPPGPVTTVTINGREYTTPFRHLLPTLPADDRAALEADIRANGVTVPVVLTDAGELLDGVHRATIAAALGLTNVPCVVKPGLTPDEKRQTALNLNLHRRHLSRAERQGLIDAVLRAHPEQADNRIARTVNTDSKTVKRRRTALEATSAIPKLATTVGHDGRARRRPGPRNPTGDAGSDTPSPLPNATDDSGASSAAGPHSPPAAGPAGDAAGVSSPLTDEMDDATLNDLWPLVSRLRTEMCNLSEAVNESSRSAARAALARLHDLADEFGRRLDAGASPPAHQAVPDHRPVVK